MKKGICYWSLPKNLSFKENLDLAKKAGFDGVELAMSESGDLTINSSKEDILNLKKAVEDAGLEVSSLASTLFWDYPLTSNDKEKSEKCKLIIRKMIDAAALMNLDTILVIPGSVGVDFKKDCEVIDYDVAYDRALEAIKELSVYAEKNNVNIALENVWNKFLLSPLEFRDFIDKTGSSHVGIYFDIGNVIYTGYPEQWVKILGNRIKKVHIKDYKRNVGFVELLAGDVNFPAVMDELKKIGYDDYIISEVSANYKFYPEQMVYNSSGAMDRILNK